MEHSDLRNRFTYHPPKPGQAETYTELRDAAYTLALHINDVVPESREKALAVTNLEQAIFWANAGIARHS